jgi:FkbM family methyltransferase
MTVSHFIYSVLLKPKPLRKATNAILRALLPRTVVLHGSTVCLNPADPVVSAALMLRIYERQETTFFLAACEPGFVFLDVGANCGYYTALFLTAASRDSRIVAMEPDPECFRWLEDTVRANRGARVTCLNVAASDICGTARLYRNHDNRGDNRLYNSELAGSFCEVPVATVDSLMDKEGVAELNLIKIDVQGFEAKVLRGMRRTLERSREIVLLSEFWPNGLLQAGDAPAEPLQLLASLGFRLFHLSRRGRLLPLPDYDLFVRSYPGREYTNIVAVKGIDPAKWMERPAR